MTSHDASRPLFSSCRKLCGNVATKSRITFDTVREIGLKLPGAEASMASRIASRAASRRHDVALDRSVLCRVFGAVRGLTKARCRGRERYERHYPDALDIALRLGDTPVVATLRAAGLTETAAS